MKERSNNQHRQHSSPAVTTCLTLFNSKLYTARAPLSFLHVRYEHAATCSRVHIQLVSVTPCSGERGAQLTVFHTHAHAPMQPGFGVRAIASGVGFSAGTPLTNHMPPYAMAPLLYSYQPNRVPHPTLQIMEMLISSCRQRACWCAKGEPCDARLKMECPISFADSHWSDDQSLATIRTRLAVHRRSCHPRVPRSSCSPMGTYAKAARC